MIIIDNKDNIPPEINNIDITTIIKPKKKKIIKNIEYNKNSKKEENPAKQLSDYCNKNGKVKISQLKLSRLGIMYRFNNYSLTVTQYNLIRLAISLFISISSYIIIKNYIYSNIIVIISYLFIDILFKEMNKKDNKQILTDICNIYTILNIDILQGKYVTDCFEHITEIIKSKRLKYAFNELIMNLGNRNTTIEESLILFNNRFNSKELEKLSIYIAEIVKLGINKDYANKLNKESGLIISNMNKEKSQKIIQRINIINFILFIIIISFLIYYFYISFNLNGFIIKGE